MTDSCRRYDPFSALVRANPYPHYARLRAEPPARAGDCWIVSRHADVVSVLSNPADFSSAKSVGPDKIPGVPMMLTQDPPVHTRLRALVSRAFTPRMIARLETRIRVVADRLIDSAFARGAFELVGAVGSPLPLIVTAEILGVDTERSEDIRRWSDATFEQLGGRVTPEGLDRYLTSFREFKAFLLPIIAARRARPEDDLLSVLAAVSDERGELGLSEILNFALLLLAAGNETTTNLISNVTLALIEHPAEAEKLRRDPSLAAGAIEEVLRFDSPVQGLFRTTTRAVEIGGSTIPEDTKVMVLYASANRDPSRFPEPDRFDIERTPNHHLAFGHGIHFCLGAQLARLEARVFLESVLARRRALALSASEPGVRLRNPLLRGFERLALVAQPAATARLGGPGSARARSTTDEGRVSA